MNLDGLKQPFEPNDIEFRAGATNQQKTSALALPYITSRAVMDRLDEVCGLENWQDTYTTGPNGGVLCGISIRIDDEWITKWDGADNTNFEAVKGGLSDAFKRAAVKWGIGRYLYALPTVWVTATQRGKSISIDEDEARRKLFGQQPSKHTPQKQSPQQNGNSKPASKQEKADPWPAKSGPVFEFCQAVRKQTNYYTAQMHLYNALGGWGNLSDEAEFEAKLSAALDHAKEKQAA